MKLHHIVMLVLAGVGLFYIFHMVTHHRGVPLNPLSS